MNLRNIVPVLRGLLFIDEHYSPTINIASEPTSLCLWQMADRHEKKTETPFQTSPTALIRLNGSKLCHCLQFA